MGWIGFYTGDDFWEGLIQPYLEAGMALTVTFVPLRNVENVS